jgi:ubiquinone/menaquinone biosynthesis C-methylase UbiE
MVRRAQLIPWRSAGQMSERQASGDDVVRATGWVFNNETGSDLTLEQFVATGDAEVPAYLTQFGLRGPENEQQTIVEIGCGIGRMTCAFTREFGMVIGCDLDAGFLERTHETVGRFGRVDRLRTSHVADGQTLDLPDASADIAFSYITLQHCDADDALDLTSEAVRITKPGGKIALNYRGRTSADIVLLPVGSLMRAAFRIPAFGNWLAQRRFAARLGWQANRLNPDQVIGPLERHLTDIQVWRHPKSKMSGFGAEIKTFEGINPAHYWIVATTR